MKKSVYIVQKTEKKWREEEKEFVKRDVLIFKKKADAILFVMHDSINEQKQRDGEILELEPEEMGMGITVFQKQEKGERKRLGEIDYLITKQKVKGYKPKKHGELDQVHVLKERSNLPPEIHDFFVEVYYEQKELGKRIMKIATEHLDKEEEIENLVTKLQSEKEVKILDDEFGKSFVAVEKIEVL